ncbi:MAG: sigma-70 family RNA polymerase sigma factor [Planctomycetes bacterium]|nr:sigma-70 family RNA polymerase sigma factor [Planctomycetota bacterium]
MSAEPSRSLVEAASRGEAPAIEELIARHLPRLRAYVRLRMGPELRQREGSMDLVQSVCREVVEHLAGFRWEGEERFLGWLFTTALYKVQEKQRFHGRERRAAGKETRVPDDGELVAALDWLTPSRVAMGRERLHRFEEAFARLPEEYREVIALARIVGLGHREIAARMTRSEAATRKLLGRALAELGRLLGAEEG